MTVEFKFVPKISWPKNDSLLSPKDFGVSAPGALDSSDLRYPIIIDADEMMRLKRNNQSATGGGLSMTKGLVTADLDVRFKDPDTQWRKDSVSGSTHGPWKFTFLGGDVFLDVALAIYLEKSVDCDPKDKLSVAIFALIYQHELLHVLDDIDIATKWLTPHLLAEPTVERILHQGEPFVYGRADAAVNDEFHEFIAKIIVSNVQYMWAAERNRRGALRDDPAQYKIVQEKYDDLRGRQNIPPAKSKSIAPAQSTNSCK